MKTSVVVCIEIGTARSGVAYAFRDTPQEILSEQNWPYEKGNTKMRSCILLDKSGKLKSFGQQAVNEFLEFESDRRDFLFVGEDDSPDPGQSSPSTAELASPSLAVPEDVDARASATQSQKHEEKSSHSKHDQAPHHFLRNFKLALYGESMSKDPKIRTHTGSEEDKSVEFSAKGVFAEAFTFFKTHILQQLKNCHRPCTVDDITWVITVPAIWSEGAKQLMCEAAVMAGLCKDTTRPVIALEPEAAAQCVVSRMNKQLALGSVYLVCDCGGGTVDVTVHELMKDGAVREVVCRSGGRWGSVCIDENFEALLDEVFGKSVMQHYREAYPQEWEETLLNFEVVKMTTSIKESQSRKVRMPNFINAVKEATGKQAWDISAGVDGVEFLARGLLSLSGERVLSLFRPVVQQIVKHCKTTLAEAPPCQYLFLVGGLAESSVLEDAFHVEFDGKLEIVRPPHASLAVLTGGVMYGLNPSMIAKRISPFGYGIDSHGPFDPAKHDPAKKVMLKDGRVRTEKLISYHIHVGQEVGIDERFQRCYGPLYSNQETVDLRVIQTSNKHALYTDDVGSRCVGVLSLLIDPVGTNSECKEDPSKIRSIFRSTAASAVSKLGPSDRDIMVQIGVGGTQVKVSAVDVVSGKEVKAQFNVLSDV